ncbi:alpha/beta fold hydrolase [Rhodococcus globerulus]|uniref:alpha/beta fold hydrolase n=1 Tax=Rhodococcus globerulus TaxID=33008 RepID=UPI001F348B97|nr:alpha/beta hydrolase [Rhodococcus globerulus]MCE4268940.1 alpha/beta hydrolase [Rhodococcus globerulus]
MKISRVFTAILSVVVVSTAGMILGSGGASAAPQPTVVLVHGAFADATSWDGVAADLRSRGYEVVTPDNPLRGPSYDSAVIEKTVADIDGPVVLVGHSYGGAVITNVHDPKVQSMVYIAAFAPVEGEPVQITIDPIRFPGSQLLPPALGLKIVDDAHAIGGKNVDGYVTDEYFHSVFAQDVSDETAATMLAHQKSAALWANLELGGPPSWANTPTWYLVAGNDRVIPATAQRFMANRMGATTSELPTSHASLVSQPGAVADVIVAAAHS